MDLIHVTNLSLILATVLSVGFPLFGVLTTHRFNYRLSRPPSLKKVGVFCSAWVIAIATFGAFLQGGPEGLLRHAGESWRLLEVVEIQASIANQEVSWPRRGYRKYWITIAVPSAPRIQVSSAYYETVTTEQTISVRYTSFPRVYWPTEDLFSTQRLHGFLWGHSSIVFLSFGFFAFAWIPEKSKKPPSEI